MPRAHEHSGQLDAVWQIIELIIGGFLDVIDHHHIVLRLHWIQFQSELLLDGGVQARRRIRLVRIAPVLRNAANCESSGVHFSVKS